MTKFYYYLLCILLLVSITSCIRPVQKQISPTMDYEIVGQYQQVRGIQALTVLDNYAYIGQEGYFTILDVKDPSHPKLVSRLSLKSDEIANVSDIFIDNKLAFVANLHDNLDIIDISDPTNAKLLNPEVKNEHNQEQEMGQEILEVLDVNSELVYLLANGCSSTTICKDASENIKMLQIWDASNPSSPHILSVYEPNEDNYLQTAAISEQIGLIAQEKLENESVLQLLDFEDPLNPKILYEIAFPDSFISDILIFEQFAIVTGHNQNDGPFIQVYEISKDKDLTFVASFDDEWHSFMAPQIHLFDNEQAAFNSNPSNEIQFVNLSDLPKLKAENTLIIDSLSNNWPLNAAFFVADNKLFFEDKDHVLNIGLLTN